jgi:hypothetical protein
LMLKDPHGSSGASDRVREHGWPDAWWEFSHRTCVR